MFSLTSIIGYYLYFPFVNKLKNILQILQLDIRRHDHDWVLTRMFTEDHLKVGRTGSQDDLVGLDGVGGVMVHVGQHQGHVGEGFRQEDLVKHRQHVVLIVSPFQVEQLVLIGSRPVAEDSVHGESVTN